MDRSKTATYPSVEVTQVTPPDTPPLFELMLMILEVDLVVW